MSAFKTIIIEPLQTQLPHLCSYCVHTQVFQAPEPFRITRAYVFPSYLPDTYPMVVGSAVCFT